MTTYHSRTKAVRAFCASCISDPTARGSEIAQITACATITCALHPVRPTTELTPQVLRWIRYETDNRMGGDTAA